MKSGSTSLGLFVDLSALKAQQEAMWPHASHSQLKEIVGEHFCVARL